jgi:quercetin dioxygenase-like cupin family protein
MGRAGRPPQHGIDDFRFSIHDSSCKHHRGEAPMPNSTPWTKIEKEQLNPLITRQMVSGQDGTLGRVCLSTGAVVPRHSHRSEQYTMILSGALKFLFDDGSTTIVRAGEILLIPADVAHAAEALEDTVDIDFFAPRREDWIRKDDAYLRAAAPASKG